MNPPEYLSVRFHFRGEFEHDGKEWMYKGGNTGMSTVHMSKLSLPELKKHLADHVSCSAAFLEKTSLCWKIPGKTCRAAVIWLEDQGSMRSMAKYITDADIMDLYARHPTEEEFEEHVDVRENVPETMQNKDVFGGDADPIDRDKQEHDPTDRYNTQQNVVAKGPTFGASMEAKGKGIKEPSSDEYSDLEDSDFLCDHDADDSNSSAEDDETISYRLQATELKKKIKKKMLGEEEIKGCTVPEEFIALVRGSYVTFTPATRPSLWPGETAGGAAASPSRHRLPLSADQRRERRNSESRE